MHAQLMQEWRAIVGPAGLITQPEQLQTYECDGLTNFRVVPAAVLLPTNAGQVQAIVRVCARERIPFVARGSGTGLSGGRTADQRRHRDQPDPAQPHPCYRPGERAGDG